MAEIVEGDCIEVMRGMDADSVDAVVTDPPYGLEFMGKEWDRLISKRPVEQEMGQYTASGRKPGRSSPFIQARVEKYIGGHAAQAWHEAWAREALRVLKPGGHLLAFGGTRTYHRLVCAIEDAGFEIRDRFLHLKGGGAVESLPGEIAWVYGSG